MSERECNARTSRFHSCHHGRALLLHASHV
jgi:hypothetical protein